MEARLRVAEFLRTGGVAERDALTTAAAALEEAAAATSGDLTGSIQSVRGALVGAGQAIEQRRELHRPADRVHRCAEHRGNDTGGGRRPLGPA